MPRQILFNEDALGRAKAEAAAEALKDSDVEPVRARLDAANIDRLLGGSDYVIDATDSVETKLLINDFCMGRTIPFCYGGVRAWGGMALAVNSPAQGGCLRCLFGEFSDHEISELGGACQQQGIVGPAAGVVGILQAQAAREVLSGTSAGESKLLRYEIRAGTISSTTVLPTADCPRCRRPEAELDLRSEVCPMTFLHTKLALEKIAPGARLRVLFGNETSSEEVARSCALEGHKLISAARSKGGQRWDLIIERGAK